MKAWLLSTTGFLLLLGFGIVSNRYLQHSSVEMVRLINRIEANIDSHKWQPAAKNLVKASHFWAQTKPWWSLVIHHQEIDNIENALVKLEKAVRTQELGNSQMSSGELQHFLQHIPQREKFTIINIL